MFGTAQQAFAFFLALYAGLAAGILYDALGAVRRILHAGTMVTALFDLIFWILCAGLVALAGALAGMEGFRLYLALGALCGGLIWKCGIGKVVSEACKWCAQAGKRGKREETHGQG